jgi:hypothetical protein
MSTDWSQFLDVALPGSTSVPPEAHETAPVDDATPAAAPSLSAKDEFESANDRLTESRRKLYGTARMVELEPREFNGYLGLLKRFVDKAPWGHELPDKDMVADQFEGLRLMTQLQSSLIDPPINASTGLPTRVAFQMLSATRDDLNARLSSASAKKAARTGDTALNTQLQLHRALSGLRPSSINEVRAHTIDMDLEAGTRTVLAFRDRLVHPGVLQRISLELRRPLKAESRSIMQILRGQHHAVSRDGGEWQFNEEFEGLLSRFSGNSLDELAQIVHAHYGDDCIRLSRGTMGPFWFDGGDPPEDIAALLDNAPGSVIGNFNTERIVFERQDDSLELRRSKEARWLATSNLAPDIREIENIADSRATEWPQLRVEVL